MERSRFSTITSLLTALLFAGTIVLGGCSDTLTGTTPPDSDEVAVKKAQHNKMDQDGGTTEPVAGHNTSDED